MGHDDVTGGERELRPIYSKSEKPYRFPPPYEDSVVGVPFSAMNKIAIVFSLICDNDLSKSKSPMAPRMANSATVPGAKT